MLETNNVQSLLQAITDGILEKKGRDIVQINLAKTGNSICDYFVVCEADSTTQVRAIADSIDEFTYKTLNESPLRKEGLENCIWVLLDYGNVFVHIFQKEYRDFYKLEDLWSDGSIKKIA